MAQVTDDAAGCSSALIGWCNNARHAHVRDGDLVSLPRGEVAGVHHDYSLSATIWRLMG
jgi:hypothetical protein